MKIADLKEVYGTGFRLYKKYPFSILIATVITILSSIWPLYLNPVNQAIIDNIQLKNQGEFYSAIAAFVIITLIVLALNSIRDIIKTNVNAKVKNAYRSMLFESALKVRMDIAEKRRTQEDITVINDDCDYVFAMSSDYFNLISTVALFISSLMWLSNKHWLMGITIAAAGAIMVLVSLLYGKLEDFYMTRFREKDVTYRQGIFDSFRGLNTIRLYNLYDYFKNRIKGVSDSYENFNKKSTAVLTTERPLVSFIMNGSVVVLFLIASGLGNSMHANVSDYIIIASMATGILDSVAYFPNLINIIRITIWRFSNIKGLTECPHDTDDGEIIERENTGYDIKIEDLTFRYDDTAPIFNKFNLEIAEGNFVTISTPSGSGKTTLFKLISGFCKPQKGSIRLGGVDYENCTSKFIRYRISYIPQDSILFKGSIRDNITICNPEISDDLLNAILAETGLSETLMKRDGGIDSDAGERGNLLSGGERQRVSIARALVKNSDIFLIDEGTSALDPENISLFLKVIDRLKRLNKTVIVITHEHEIWKMGDIRIGEGWKICTDSDSDIQHEAAHNTSGAC